jgi:anti-repressor protein
MSNIKSLIPVVPGEIGGASVQTANGRALHAYLENRDHFATWIKDRIEQYGFVENQDFTTYSEVSEKGGRPAKEYAITLDMAKELAMVERNHKGKQARQYFIECERRAKTVDPMEVLSDPAAMRGLLLGYSEKVLALESKVQEQAPKVEVFERIADATGSMTLRETATTLKYPERKMILWMQQKGWLYRRPGRGTLLGYAERIKSGHLEHKLTLIHNERTGEDETRESVRVTPLGLTVLAQKLGCEVSNGDVPAGVMGMPDSRNYAERRA